jgi:hypothetical protein
VSELLSRPPYGPRDDKQLLRELNELTQHHRRGCAEYARIWPENTYAGTLDEVPYVHAGLFKHVTLRTTLPEIKHERVVLSSATTSGQSSRILLDRRSSQLQNESSLSILKDFVGDHKRPLFVLDTGRSLAQRREISARLAAAMSLQPLAAEMVFLLDADGAGGEVKWNLLTDLLQTNDEILVYGFTTILWLTFGAGKLPDAVRDALCGKCVHFVHSGGWKKLEALRVSTAEFNAALLTGLAPSSRVIDFYGLVEQVGVIYPLCEQGFRHIPTWAAVVVRDSTTLRPLADEPGQLHLMNTLAWGAPYHSVLTEDMGQLVAGECPCGRSGPRFKLLGRLPKAELRGCANV